MKELMIKGTTNEEKFKSTERILKHLGRRSQKAVGVYTPPVMISAYIDKPVDGVLYKQMFPLAGKMVNICAVVEKLPEKTANIDIEIVIIYPHNKMEKLYFAGRKRIEISQIEKKFPAGTRIEIRLINASAECSGIWLAGSYEVAVNKTKLSTVIIDELEDTYDRLQKDISANEGANEKEGPSTELAELIESIKPSSGATGS